MTLAQPIDLAMALDPARLFRRAVGARPDDWQARMLRSPARQIIMNTSRQAGKSTSTAVLALHTALYQPESLVLILAPALRQSQELFRKVKDQTAALGMPAEAIEQETALQLTLANGARVISLPGSTDTTIRGYSSVSLLIVDEAARMRDDLYRALRPMLAVSQGRIVLLSSPFGQRGFFYEEWVHGGPAWQRFEVPATMIPRIPASFLEEERRVLGPFYAGEYMCQFLDTQFQLYSTSDIDAAVSHDVKPLFGGF